MTKWIAYWEMNVATGEKTPIYEDEPEKAENTGENRIHNDEDYRDDWQMDRDMCYWQDEDDLSDAQEIAEREEYDAWLAEKGRIMDESNDPDDGEGGAAPLQPAVAPLLPPPTPPHVPFPVVNAFALHLPNPQGGVAIVAGPWRGSVQSIVEKLSDDFVLTFPHGSVTKNALGFDDAGNVYYVGPTSFSPNGNDLPYA